MSAFLWTTYGVLWVLVVVLVAAVLLMYRQFGLTYLNSRRHLDAQGPDLGSPMRTVEVTSATGSPEHLSWAPDQPTQRYTFSVFATPTCEICSRLVPEMSDLAADWPEVSFVWIDGVRAHSVANPVVHRRLANWRVFTGDPASVHARLGVSATPFGILILADGTVVNKALINTSADAIQLLTHSGLRTSDLGLDTTYISRSPLDEWYDHEHG